MYRYEDEELKDKTVFFSYGSGGMLSPIESYTDPETGYVYYKKVIRR